MDVKRINETEDFIQELRKRGRAGAIVVVIPGYDHDAPITKAQLNDASVRAIFGEVPFREFMVLLGADWSLIDNHETEDLGTADDLWGELNHVLNPYFTGFDTKPA